MGLPLRIGLTPLPITHLVALLTTAEFTAFAVAEIPVDSDHPIIESKLNAVRYLSRFRYSTA